MTIALAAGVGVLVGVVVGTLGAGGGILSLPILVYVLGMAPHSAATASLVIVGATSLVSLVPHARRGNVRWGQGLVFGLLGMVGAVGGARLAALVDADLLMALLAVLLLVVSVVMLSRAMAGRRVGTAAVDDDDASPPSGRLARVAVTVVVASLVGLLTGFFGVGGGFIVVPALLLVMRVSMRVAVGTSLLVIVVNTALGLAGRVGQDFAVDWAMVAAFAAASMLGGLLGGRLSGRARPQTLTLLFALLLLAVALATGVQAVPALLAA